MADLTTRIRLLWADYGRKLDDLHDDFVYTRMLWRSVQVRVQRHKRKLSVRNRVTNSVVDGAQLAGKARESVRRLKSRSFKDIVAQFELFVAELLREWLASRPELLAEKALNVGTLLASQTLAEAQAAAVREAIDATIADRMYGRPDKWFNYLKKNVGVYFDAADESSFVEMKARRDVLEHHDGIVEATYVDKAKAAARYAVGEPIQLADEDVDEAFRLTRRLVQHVTASAVATLTTP